MRFQGFKTAPCTRSFPFFNDFQQLLWNLFVTKSLITSFASFLPFPYLYLRDYPQIIDYTKSWWKIVELDVCRRMHQKRKLAVAWHCIDVSFILLVSRPEAVLNPSLVGMDICKGPHWLLYQVHRCWITWVLLYLAEVFLPVCFFELLEPGLPWCLHCVFWTVTFMA